MKKLNVGVIGTGHVGSFHAKIYSQMPDVKVTFLCDVIEARAKQLGNQLKSNYSNNYKDGFSLVDAVSIAAPTPFHYEIAKDFLKHGKDVLIEKPITINLKQAQHLIQIADKNSCILQVGHVERFNKAFSAIRDVPGEIKFIECHRIGPFTQRCIDVSVVLDLMIHDLDIILELLPCKIKSINATGLKVMTDFPDIANARIAFENGAVCNITSSRVSDDALRKIRIFKENSYISLDYKLQEVKIYQKLNKKIIKKQIPIKKEQPLQLELKSFINSVKKRIPPLVSGKTAKKALETALKIEKIISRTS
ncbi:MAG: Gfo/Idh/MocA family oxidoreductase [Candidatus Saelkia tenebricola]|nr:Gfo/Idh/MocA family oxidoreductase [Candidatus Saelkia tenebricola]